MTGASTLEASNAATLGADLGFADSGRISNKTPNLTRRPERNQGTDSFLLLDSGAQYVDGTTDATRNQAACDFSFKFDHFDLLPLQHF